MKKVFWVVIGLLIYLLFLLLNTTWLVGRTIPLILEKQWPDLVLESYSIESQSFHFPHSIRLKNGKFVITHKEKTYTAVFQETTLYDVFNSLFFTHKMKFAVKELDVDWEGGSLRGVEPKLVLAFDDYIFQKVSGIASAKEYSYGPYSITDIYARISGDKAQMQVFEITAGCYEGGMQGQVMVSKEPYLNYIIWLKCDNMAPQNLENIYSDIFKNVDGNINAAIRIGGDASRLNLLALNLEMTKNAKLDKELLLALRNIANQREIGEIDAILQQYDVLIADEAYIQVRSGQQGDNLNVIIVINSREAGFYFKKIIPISYEEILSVLLRKNIRKQL